MDHFEIALGMKNMYNKIAKSNRYIIDLNPILEIICQQIIKVAHSLVRHLFFQPCAKIIETIKEIIHSEHFLKEHRLSPSDFSRDRKLSFSKLVLFFINLNKRSYQDELDSFFKTLCDLDIDEHKVTKAALSKARRKLDHKAFIDLNVHLSALFHQYFSLPTWHGFNPLSLDGSTVRLPYTEAIVDHFDAWHPRQGGKCCLARISQLYNVMSKSTVDAIICPKSTGERELARQHFDWVGTDDLVLLDRGYTAFWLFKTVLMKHAHFCARVSNTHWNAVRKFYRSGKKEKIVTIKPSYPAIQRCREHGLDTTPLTVRLIRVDLDNGETEILMTSLLDTIAYPQSEFAALYHLRWSVEEDYKVIKHRLEVENFSGKTVHSIYQDFHAKIFTKSLTAVLSYPLRDVIKTRFSHRQYDYQLNVTQVLSRMKDTIVLLLHKNVTYIEQMIQKLHKLFLTLVEPIRPGRKYPRKPKFKGRSFYTSYKPIR